MKNLYIYLISIAVLSCNNITTNEQDIKNDTLSTKTESSVIPTIYKYEIKNIKNGKTILLTEEEYLKSDYINNNDYSVKEIPLVEQH